MNLFESDINSVSKRRRRKNKINRKEQNVFDAWRLADDIRFAVCGQSQTDSNTTTNSQQKWEKLNGFCPCNCDSCKFHNETMCHLVIWFGYLKSFECCNSTLGKRNLSRIQQTKQKIVFFV